MAVSRTDEVTGPAELAEAAALLTVLERYHQRVVEQLAVTEELLGRRTLALLEMVARHL